MSRPALSDATQKKVLRETRDQTNSALTSLTRRFNDLRGNGETQRWMDWSIRSAWKEHAQNFGSLVDEALIPQLARILGVTDREVRGAHKETSKPATVRSLVKRQADTDLFNMTYDCFLLGVLLRGLYHEIAISRDEHIAHHPLRMAFLPPTGGKGFLFDQTSTENYLTNLILRDALREATLGARLSRWADDIAVIRRANRHGRWPAGFDLRPREEPRLAKEAAVEAARTVGIYVHPRELEEFLAGTAKATIDIGSYLLTPFVGYADKGLEYFGIRTDELVREGVRAYYGRRRRLSRLAVSVHSVFKV